MGSIAWLLEPGTWWKMVVMLMSYGVYRLVIVIVIRGETMKGRFSLDWWWWFIILHIRNFEVFFINFLFSYTNCEPSQKIWCHLFKFCKKATFWKLIFTILNKPNKLISNNFWSEVIFTEKLMSFFKLRQKA